MERSFISNSINIKQVLIDEVALNGLEGIGLDLLWQYVGKRIQAPVTQKLKHRFWSVLTRLPDLLFYKLPKPVPRFTIADRFSIVDEETGHFLESEEPIDGPYEYCSIENVFGSCVDYNTRLLLPNATLQIMNYDDVELEYGDYLVIVASQEQRWSAMVPHLPISYLSEIMPIQYCLLELIARGRENGQIPIGKSNITKVVKDPKLFFYNRLPLIKMNFITSVSVTQVTGGRAIKVLLIRLKRFHTPFLMCLPRVGKMYALIEHLKSKPDYTDYTDDIIEKGIMTSKQICVLNKRQNMFKLSLEEDRTLPKRRKLKKKITMIPFSEESAESEDDVEDKEPLKCKYKVGVGLLRQAYELFVEIGLKGLTQSELGQLLGIEFYTCRSICRFLTTRHLLKTTVEEQGKHKTSRYIAVAASNDTGKKFEEARQKYQYYIDNPVVYEPKVQKNEPSTSDAMDVEEVLSQIEEIKVINGCANMASESFIKPIKQPTLRQLSYANGMVEVVREKKLIVGYGPLSTIVAERIKDTPMDSKILKRCLQRLINDKLIKLVKISWPNNPEKFIMLICYPTIQLDDPLLLAKYKEICIRDITKDRVDKVAESTPIEFNINHHNKYSYPRYTKMHKIHSLLVKLVYEEGGKHDPHLPKGFCSFTTILSEMTVDVALGCLRTVSLTEIADLKINDKILSTKLSQCSTEVHDMLFRRGQFKTTLKFILKLLGLSGLIRMVGIDKSVDSKAPPIQNQPCSEYYVCKNITLINTAGKWPRVADLNKLKISFTFESPKDVDKFWETILQISMDTYVVGRRNNFKTFINKLYDENNAIKSDTGQLKGDGRGPCGFDSGFFLDSRHGWQNFIARKIKKVRKIAVTKKVKAKSQKKAKPQKPHKKRKKKVNAFNQRGTAKSDIADESFENKELLNEMNSEEKAIVWTSEDDLVIVICMAAITIMSPKAHPGSLHVRNAVIKDILSIKDPKKTVRVCHWRAFALQSDTEKCYERECILNELRRRASIIETYENLFATLRVRYTGLSDSFLKAARIRMLELVWIIKEIIKKDTYKKGSPCIAVDYKEFHKKYRIDLKASLKNTYHTPDTEPMLATLKEGIVMAVMHTFNDSSTSLTAPMATQIHSMLKTYPEPILRMAVDDLRKAGVLTTKDRNGQQKDMKSMVKLYYKIAFAYRRRFLNKYTEDFIQSTAKTLEESSTENNVKGSPAVNCVSSELCASGCLDVFVTTPAVVSAPSTSLMKEEEFNVIDIETKYKLKGGLVAWAPKENNKRLLPTQLQDLKFSNILNALKRHFMRKFPDSKQEFPEDDILSLLKQLEQTGITFSELLNKLKYDEYQLLQKLKELTEMGAIARVGVNENLIIHIDYINYWSMQLPDSRIIPAPWITMKSDIDYSILMKWMSVIVYRVFESPGISIEALVEACDFLSARHVQSLCQFLQEFHCVKLQVLDTKEPDLFSDEASIEFKEFHEFASTKKIFVFSVVHMISTYSHICKLLDFDSFLVE